MLCRLCSTFTSHIWTKDFTTWRRVDEYLFTFKHGNYHEILASSEAGCEVCRLFHATREERMPGYNTLGDKWLMKWASVDVIYRDENTVPSFKLISIAPEKPFLEFEFFDLHHWQPAIGSPRYGLPWRIPTHFQDTTLALASQWLHECEEMHTACRRHDRTRYPTRVIDVSSQTNLAEPRLRDTTVQTLRHGLELGYATLSHCWGTSKRLTTTTSNLSDHMKAIPMASLPSTFRDAIEITRRLNIRYLWIDALCIIQDSATDWDHEAAAMDDIFTNARVSLSALDAEDSNVGFLHARQKVYAIIDPAGANVAIRPKLLSVEEGISGSKLETRAWCMQEKLLPRAVLHFGREQLYWRCFTTEASESCPDPDHAFEYVHPLRALTDPTREHKFNDAWLGLVEQYSERLLTKPSDRLPAIRGLARYYTNEVERERLGELWDNDSCVRILWQRAYWHLKAPSGQERPNEIRLAPSKMKALREAEQAGSNEDGAPSWSWASLNRPVNWSWRCLSPIRILSPLDASIDMKYMQTRRDSISQPVAPDHCRIDFKDPIYFEAHLRRGTCKITNNQETGGELATFSVSGGRKDEIICVLDRRADFNSMSCYCVFIACFGPSMAPKRTDTGLSASSTGSARLKRPKKSEHDRGYVLLLSGSRSESGEVFGLLQRIGMGYGSADGVRRIFEDSPRSKIIVW